MPKLLFTAFVLAQLAVAQTTWNGLSFRMSEDDVKKQMSARELSAYTINVGKAGLAGIKMTRSESQGSNGSGTFAGSVPGTGVMTMGNATMTDMASLMQRVMLDRPVVDQSGLTGRYNIALKWAPDETQFTQMNLMLAPPPGADLDPLPDLVTAFQEQLGMKLESTKAPVDVIVIDKISRPSEN